MGQAGLPEQPEHRHRPAKGEERRAWGQRADSGPHQGAGTIAGNPAFRNGYLGAMKAVPPIFALLSSVIGLAALITCIHLQNEIRAEENRSSSLEQEIEELSKRVEKLQRFSEQVDSEWRVRIENSFKETRRLISSLGSDVYLLKSDFENLELSSTAPDPVPLRPTYGQRKETLQEYQEKLAEEIRLEAIEHDLNRIEADKEEQERKERMDRIFRR